MNKQKAEEGHDDDYKDCLKPRMITSNDWAGHMIPLKRHMQEMMLPKYTAGG